jgi:hypothetical protein
LCEALIDADVENLKRNKKGDIVADIKLLVNGKEVNFKKIIRGWENQIDRLIHIEAMNFIRDKFNDISDAMDSFMEKLEG